MTMRTPSARQAGGLTVWLVLVAVACLLAPAVAYAATPASGTVSGANLTVTWTGNPQPPTASATCNGANNAACDNFKLTILPPSYSFAVEITAIAGPSDDYDMEVYGPDGTLLDDSGEAPGQPETVILNNPAAGTYTVSVSNYAAVLAYNGQAQIVSAGPPPPPGDPDDAVSFSLHTPPPGVGTNSGEPSIGCNWNTDRTMFIAGLETLRLDWNDCTSPPRETWTDVSFLTTSIISLDPILFTDPITGRTFASQLSAKCSSMAFTDDDGATWTPSQGCGINAGVDHQTVGGGPFHAPLTRDPGGLLYPHAVYYCSQDVAIAQCARSDDGGITFGPAVPIYNISECGGLHGHVKVAPDGTVYVPAKGCNGEQAVTVSEDNGITWEVRRVPGTSAGTWDPSVGISDDGTVYIGMTNGGHPYAAVSHDQGRTWQHLQDIGTDFGIQNTAFPVAVGGDGDRAAIGFLGAPQGGAGGGQDVNSGHVWHGYVAVTYDGGQTWTTVNATPGDPVQRGTICSSGTTCNSTRNLLDFNDMSVDREGRILFGFADGCIGSCSKTGPNSSSELATVARQKSGKRLFEAFDATTVPAAPMVTATIENEGTASQFNRVSWEEPFDGNSAILGYEVYRRRDDEATRSLIASVDDTTFSYDDNSVVGSFDYYYSVSARNAFGEGPSCGEVKAGGGPDDPGPVSHCVLPGIPVAQDLVGDTSITAAGDPSLDIVLLSAAEPAQLDGGEKLIVTIEVDDMSVPHPSAAWRALWTSPDGVTYFVSLESCDATAGLQCSYGTFDGTLFSAQGNLADCSFSADGEITIGVDKALVGISDATDNGKGLGGFSARTQVFVGALCSGLLSTTDTAGPGSYTIRTNASCEGDAPIARDDEATTRENVPVVINVVANDTSFDGALTVTQVSAPANGQVANNGDGTVTYNPDTGFSGVDFFTYTIRDEGGLTDSATVTVTVTPRCPPTTDGSFSDDFEPTAEDGWLVATPVNNLGPLSPTWAVTADSGATSPTNSYFTDATTLDEKDDRLIAPAQDLSDASSLVFFHRFETEATYDGGVLEVSTDGGDSWADVIAAGGSFVSGAYNGVIDSGFGSAIAGRAAWTGGSSTDPMARVEVDLGAFAGNDVWVRWRLVADPLALGSVPGAGWWIDDVSFTNLTEPGVCENRAPTPEDDFATTDENQAVTIDVLANDSDPDGDPIAVSQVGAASNGTTTLNNDDTVTYQPDPGFSGTDSFEYEVCDFEKCASATVTVLVNDGNLPPTANDDAATTEEGTPVTIQVLANDTDPENEPLSIGSFSQGTNGSVTDNGNGTLTYSPDAGFTGIDSFTYEACDPPGLCDEATVTVTVNPGQTGGGSGKVTGGGWIADSSADGKANFGFNAKSKSSGVDGRLTYDSGSGGVNVKGTASSLTISGNTAQFSGVCSYAGGACTFRVTVEDNGEPGSSDRFAIEVMNAAGATVHSADAILGGGNIQIH